jgi:hypothetical protein
MLWGRYLDTSGTSSQYRTVLRWLRETVDSQEIVQEDLEQTLLPDTKSDTEIYIKGLLQEIISEGLAK